MILTKKQFDLLVIGELCVDLILAGGNVVPSFSQSEQLVNDALLVLGSSSAILACGAAKLGLKVAFSGSVGDDIFGNFIIQELLSRNIDLKGVIIDQTKKTGITLNLSRPTDRAILTYPGSMENFSGSEISLDLIRNSTHVHLSSYFLQTSLQAHVPGLFTFAHDIGATTSLDPGWDPTGFWDAGIHSVLANTDLFLPNKAEASRITGCLTVEDSLTRLSNGQNTIIIKNGDQGAIASSQGLRYIAKAFPVQSLDTVGAGDNFNAGYLYGFLNNFSIEDSLRWGSACGAIATLGIGGTATQKNSKDVQEWMQQKHFLAEQFSRVRELGDALPSTPTC